MIDNKLRLIRLINIKINKYGVKCRTSVRFWENRLDWIDSIDLNGILDIG